ncbi:ERCC4 domain-containing protein [Aspergillus aurantiobrunneus]
MPEVISLLSSTPPPPANRREPPSSIRRFHSSPPAPADIHSIPLLSDDIDISQFTCDDADDLDKPPKRRRLSPVNDAAPKSPRSNANALPSRSRNSLFVFSDEIVPSDGPSNAHSKTSAYPLDSDPIVFTSSAPEPIRRSPSPKTNKNQQGPRKTRKTRTDDNSDGGIAFGGGRESRNHTRKDDIQEFSSDPFNVPDPSELFNFRESEFAVPQLQSGFSGRTANLLASLGSRSKSNLTGTSVRTKQKSRRSQDIDDEDNPDELPESRGTRKPKKATATTKRTTMDEDAKAKERETTKAQRGHEKQLEKERKQKLKGEKAKEKQLAAEIAQVNKLKVEKKDSTPEMILDLASSFKETSVGNQAAEYMRLLGVEHTFFDSPVPNIVKWRRKMKATYNKTLKYWEPCELHIREEEHVLCLLTAQEFVDMVTSSLHSDTSDAPNALEVHVLRLKRIYPRCTVVYLIEGLTAWMRKNTNSRNRAYQAEFRRNLDEVQGSTAAPATSTSSRRKKANRPDPTPPIDDDTIEDALLNLQVTHNCLIHQTAAPPESAEWVKVFTEHVSTVPYRRERMEDNDSAFCMDSGQVKTGENASDTYVRMLQEVSRITGSMAYGVANQYPSVVELIKGMRRSGPGMLENVKKSANKNGALTNSRIGPAASRRLYKVFMGMDPQSTDI